MNFKSNISNYPTVIVTQIVVPKVYSLAAVVK